MGICECFQKGKEEHNFVARLEGGQSSEAKLCEEMASKRDTNAGDPRDDSTSKGDFESEFQQLLKHPPIDSRSLLVRQKLLIIRRRHSAEALSRLCVSTNAAPSTIWILSAMTAPSQESDITASCKRSYGSCV